VDWQITVLIIFGALALLLISGMPIALSFLLINLVGGYAFWGTPGLEQLILSMYTSLASFELLPLPLFILMGEVLYHSGVGPMLISVLDKLLGRVPGRLCLVSVAAGVVLAVLTGASVGSVAMLGNTLMPDMLKRGYKKSMAMGPIMASGGLAVMIPPSGLAVLLGAIGEVSIGKILVSIVIPGLIMAAFYAAYIVGRCWLQPSVAPSYEVSTASFTEILLSGLTYLLPVIGIIFLVTGVIIIGIATPTEAAATGCTGVFLMAALYKRLSWGVIKKSVVSTMEVVGMIFLVICGAKAFSTLLSFSEITKGVGDVILWIGGSPITTIIIMQAIVLVMGCFMESASIMLITLPIFMPLVKGLGYNVVWFAVIYLINIETGLLTPPFGLNIFVMKAVAPPDTLVKEIYTAIAPFVAINILIMGLIMIFPQIALCLTHLTRLW
jgi:tripartite ATP-independent transporter DctM subunit